LTTSRYNDIVFLNQFFIFYGQFVTIKSTNNQLQQKRNTTETSFMQITISGFSLAGGSGIREAIIKHMRVWPLLVKESTKEIEVDTKEGPSPQVIFSSIANDKELELIYILSERLEVFIGAMHIDLVQNVSSDHQVTLTFNGAPIKTEPK
jgi:hypothetical protein